MRKVNLNDIAEDERKSPKGKFHKFVKDISIALGREKDSLDLAKRHPFDLAQVRMLRRPAEKLAHLLASCSDRVRVAGPARARWGTST